MGKRKKRKKEKNHKRIQDHLRRRRVKGRLTVFVKIVGGLLEERGWK